MGDKKASRAKTPKDPREPDRREPDRREPVTRPAKTPPVKKRGSAVKGAGGETAGRGASLPADAAKKGALKTRKHIDLLLAMTRAQREAFLSGASTARLLEVFDTSYEDDLVNVLLDLRKSVVKGVFEALAAARKRVAAAVATLYYYKEYLTNPLPLEVSTESGESIPNYYAILGIPRDASDEELKGAFRLLSRAYDPESCPPAAREAVEGRLEEIRRAFDQVKAPERRARADQLLPNVSYLYPRRDQTWFEAVQRLLD
jgi:hypothetical protein